MEDGDAEGVEAAAGDGEPPEDCENAGATASNPANTVAAKRFVAVIHRPIRERIVG